MPGCQGAIWRIRFHYSATYHLTIIPPFKIELGAPQIPHIRGKAVKGKRTFREILNDDLWQYPVHEMMNIIFSGMSEEAKRRRLLIEGKETGYCWAIGR